MAASKQPLTCTLCLEIFRKPKILPCFHTYCEECLKKLASRHGGHQFPCPSCRKTVPVPSQGVSAFQTNFYIDSEELEKTRRKRVCKTHPDNELVSFCTSCDLAICVECMLGEHKPHDVQTMAKAAVFSQNQLTVDKLRVQKCVKTMLTLEEIALKNQKMLKDSVEEAKADTETRYAQLVSAAKRQRDAELAKLQTIAKELDGREKRDAKEISTLHEKRTGLTKMEQEIDDALVGGDHVQLVMLAGEMRTGRGSDQALQAMLPDDWPQTDVVCPTLRAADDVSSVVSATICHVTTKNVPLRVPESGWCLFETIRCSRRDIHRLVVLEDSGDVCVSYEHKDAPLQKFNKHGQLVDTVSEVTGKVAFQRHGGGGCFCFVRETDRLICAKSGRFVLECGLPDGRGLVKKVEMKSKLTCISEWIPVFTLHCTRCVAFDVDDSGTRFAVLGNDQTPDTGSRGRTRTLTIYQKPSPSPIHSLSFKSFQPSDFCFYRVAEGKEVLLVTDEIHGSIHAVCVEQGVLQHTSPVSQVAALVQPTALTTDKEGCVWIGCRDGRIFKCHPPVTD